MFRPIPMCKVNILVLSKHVAEITRRLGERGLMHFVDAVNQSNENLLSNVAASPIEQQLDSTIQDVEHLMEHLGVDLTEVIPHEQEQMTLTEMQALVRRIADQYQAEEDTITKLLENSGALAKQRSLVSTFPVQSVPLDTLRNLNHFYMVTGHLAPLAIPRAILDLGERAILVNGDGGEGSVLVLCANRNRWAVRDTLAKFGFTEIAPPEGGGDASDAAGKLDSQLESLRHDIEEHRMAVMKLCERYSGVLLVMHAELKWMRAVEAAQRHFGKVAQLYCISGWTPQEKVSNVQEIVASATGGTGVVEVIDANDDEQVRAGLESVPTQMEESTIRRPFQLLVKNFGLPGYNELDPTFFVGITFVLLFGFMFGDIGQGAVLALCGAGMWRLCKDTGLKDAGFLLMSCGLCAVVFGFCYGSFFGYESENFLRPLWLSPLHQHSITKLLLTTVGVGVIFMSVAVIINIINHFLAKKYFEGVFDRYGILGLLFYWAALLTGIHCVRTRHFPVWAAILIALPLLVLAMKVPVQKMLARRSGRSEEENGIMGEVLETAIELMETLTGYMSGTISFVRVGAYAISHAALCFAIYAIVDAIRAFPGGGLVGILVLVGGNLLVIVFEGMVAMIQGMRLEYYELFGKYFNGDGVPYKPFQISTNQTNKGEH